ncbi:MAG: hypothetical protein KKE93_03275, partial [Nanoarchaeota archaeon]|nr:hypothetical protein [Nanoarchaeota archaeon]
WAETILKSWKVLYSNVCYLKAISDLKSMAFILKKDKDIYKYSNLEKTVKEKINSYFWDEEKGYYLDWIDQKGRRRETFDSAGNILAALYVADEQKARKIEYYIIKHKLDDVPVKTNNPEYKRYQVGFLINLIGLKGFNKYHNGCSWPWIGCFDVILKTKIGMQKQAKEQLEKLAEQINRYETTAEVFDEKGNMLDCRINLFGKRIGYTSEKKFAWTAGLYILAVNEYIKNLNRTQKVS